MFWSCAGIVHTADEWKLQFTCERAQVCIRAIDIDTTVLLLLFFFVSWPFLLPFISFAFIAGNSIHDPLNTFAAKIVNTLKCHFELHINVKRNTFSFPIEKVFISILLLLYLHILFICIHSRQIGILVDRNSTAVIEIWFSLCRWKVWIHIRHCN